MHAAERVRRCGGFDRERQEGSLGPGAEMSKDRRRWGRVSGDAAESVGCAGRSAGTEVKAQRRRPRLPDVFLRSVCRSSSFDSSSFHLVQAVSARTVRARTPEERTSGRMGQSGRSQNGTVLAQTGIGMER